MIRSYCFSDNCRTVKPSCKKKVMIFHASKQMILEWKLALPGVTKKEFTVKDGICERHFRDENIKRVWKSVDVG